MFANSVQFARICCSTSIHRRSGTSMSGDIAVQATHEVVLHHIGKDSSSCPLGLHPYERYCVAKQELPAFVMFDLFLAKMHHFTASLKGESLIKHRLE